MENTIRMLLDDYAEIKSRVDVLQLQIRELKEGVLTDEQKRKIAEIDDEFSPAIVDAKVRIWEMENKIRSAVHEFGQSVKGKYFMATFGNGRVSWDDKVLMGLSIAMPEILTARKVGEPVISIRSVKDK